MPCALTCWTNEPLHLVVKIEQWYTEKNVETKEIFLDSVVVCSFYNLLLAGCAKRVCHHLAGRKGYQERITSVWSVSGKRRKKFEEARILFCQFVSWQREDEQWGALVFDRLMLIPVNLMSMKWERKWGFCIEKMWLPPPTPWLSRSPEISNTFWETEIYGGRQCYCCLLREGSISNTRGGATIERPIWHHYTLSVVVPRCALCS